ncbi:uncharacterized protein EDB91DRAFT_1079307 [Suillus paluster]|uniref:uncharacterized protein n=1 Tax=Suillus paluster TaxID=48578 RepID=UPI001B866430|nr:uncharacterized protein EDB91DRAFT_1079307 [Suillus paluster]KAG1748323.1 hypothetical protein EDB91DRAFT_1079307 [Suillus paluster]
MGITDASGLKFSAFDFQYGFRIADVDSTWPVDGLLPFALTSLGIKVTATAGTSATRGSPQWDLVESAKLQHACSRSSLFWRLTLVNNLSVSPALIVLVSAGGSDASMINSYGGLVLGITALDGLLLGSKFFIMEISAMRWVTRLRDTAFSRVLSQDKSWFDRPENGAAKLTQVIVKDGDDAYRCCWRDDDCWTCLGYGLGVAVDVCWAGYWACFVGVMGLQTGLMAKCEVHNKRAREEVARVYYESILNVRGIRAMSLEPVLQA